jgi:hypothetical protein
VEIFASQGGPPVSTTPAANFVSATGVVDTGGKVHLNRVGDGNDDISSEEHFKNLKTIRGSYLLLELFIFVQIFEFDRMTQSL